MNRPYILPKCPHCTNLNRNRSGSDLLPTDHFLRESRDISSPIQCPELKKVICQKCFKEGHTKSHCPSLIKSWHSYLPTDTENNTVSNSEKKKEFVLPNLSVNKFSVLLDDETDSSDSEVSSLECDREGLFRPKSPDYPPPDWLN
jgi:hypothetical protein